MSSLEQSRHLVTEIPGPASLQLAARRAAAVARGVGSAMPVYAARAGGAIVEDVDGNRLIDLA
ncbi:MAG: 4-aminobutyrate--2-oxoglutarate transaminase, partial [Mycobacterium sp.]